ncbi:MAG: DUF4340 domain-containing protein [Promethearchaeota archaeon]
MKRWKPTLIVLGLFALLLAYVLIVEIEKEPPSEGEADPTPSPILDLSLDDVVTLRIQDGQRTVRIEHEEAGWRITEPRDELADSYAVFVPVDDLIRLEARMVVLEKTSDLATYGLHPAALTLTIETRSGGEERILVGRKTPDGTLFYVQHAGDARLYAVSSYKMETFFEWLLDPPYQPTPTPESG